MCNTLKPTELVVVGGGFGGLNVLKGLRRAKNLHVTLIDKSNHHLFQPLLYQVAVAALSPADISASFRSISPEQRERFVYKDRGTMSTVGTSQAVGVLLSMQNE